MARGACRSRGGPKMRGQEGRGREDATAWVASRPTEGVAQSGQIAALDGGEGAGIQDAFRPPAIALPKGGGAIRGIGEKFAANPVTGTGSMSVPIATSPGRSGFGPQLSLTYDSGAANGPFGFGWSLSLPSITRKTEKGLPQYFDAQESGVFILSGAEDLVPVCLSSDVGTPCGCRGPMGPPLGTYGAISAHVLWGQGPVVLSCSTFTRGPRLGGGGCVT